MKLNETYISHMIDEVNFLLEHSRTIEYQDLMNDEVLKRAFLRSLEVIGEAAKNVTLEFRKGHSEIGWRELVGLRDKLIHGYFGVKWEIVWDVVRNKLPGLASQFKKAIEEGQ